MKKISRIFVKAILLHPKANLLFLLILSCFSAAGVYRVQTNFSPYGWFDKEYPPLLSYRMFEQEFGNDDNIILAVQKKTELIDASTLSLLNDLTDRFWVLDDIYRVDSLANYQWTHSTSEEIIVEPLFPSDLPEGEIPARRKVALSDQVIQGFLLNKKGNVTLLHGQLKPSYGKELHYDQIYEKVLSLVGEMKKKTDVVFFISGLTAAHGALKSLLAADVLNISALLFLFVGGITLTLFRSWIALLIVNSVVGLSILVTIGVSSWLGVPLDPMSSSVPQILVAIGVADAIHILSTFFMYRNRGLELRQSVYRAMIKNLRPTVLTSATTALGFISLVSSDIVPIVNLGIMVAIGAVVAWFLTYTVTASILLLVRPPSKTRTGGQNVFFSRKRITSYIHWIDRMKWPVIISFLIMGVGGFLIARTNHVDSTVRRYLPDDHFVKVSSKKISEEFGISGMLELVITHAEIDGVKDPEFLMKVDEFASRILEHKHIKKVISLIDIVKDVNKAMNGDNPEFRAIPSTKTGVAESLLLYGLGQPQGMGVDHWMSLDGRRMRLTTWWNPDTTNEMVETIAQVRKTAQEMDLQINITGKDGLLANLGPLTLSTFLNSISITLAIVFVLMILSFGSFSFGFLTMLPNIVPLLISGAIMKWIGFPLDIGTAIVTAIALGIAVDDTIHIFTEYRTHRLNGYPIPSSLIKSIEHSGRAVVLTSFILTIGFGVFCFGRFIPTVEFGIMVALTVIWALVTDLLLLPAILLVFHRDSSPDKTASFSRQTSSSHDAGSS